MTWFKKSTVSAAILCIATVCATAQIKVSCIGDSVTYGYGIEDRETWSYPAQLQVMLGDKYDVRNFGLSGSTLLRQGHRPYNKTEQYGQAMDFAGDIAVIHLGLNDTDPRDWPNYRDNFVGDYLQLIDDVRKANPECKIWICRMTPIFDRHSRFKSGTRDWFWMEQEKIEKVANMAGVELIDLHTPLHCRPDLFKDALHPDATGAGIIARTVYSAITGDYGGLSMPMLYTDGMVLQRDKALNISGIANVGKKVTVKINGQKKTAVAGPDGKWTATLSPMKAAKGLKLKIMAESGNLEYNDVAIGEVWLASGQSNMSFRTVQSAEKEEMLDYAGKSPDIRLFTMHEKWETNNASWPEDALEALNALKYYKPTVWEKCSKENAASSSAIALSFARTLSDSLNVTIGIIQNSIGGSTTESWIDRKTLEFQFPDILRDPLNNDFIQDWARGRAAVNIKLSGNPLQRHPYLPAYLFESGIMPLDRYPIKGIIWYQGESNAHNMEAYESLFNLMLQSWRGWWDEELPFYFVQLSSLNRPSWTWFRDAQRRLARENNECEMVVSCDRGDSLDVHPTRKKDIGERLARVALNKKYGFNGLEYSGPQVESVEYKADEAYIHFSHAEGMKASDGGEINGFEISGDGENYTAAKAEVLPNGIIRLTADGVKAPQAARYAWKPYTTANLVNGSGLPASTFVSCQESAK